MFPFMCILLGCIDSVRDRSPRQKLKIDEEQVHSTLSVRMPPAKPPHGGGHRRLARCVRSTHASDAASDGAARAGGCRDLPAAVTAVTGRRRPLRPTRSMRCGGTAAALRPAPARQTGRGESCDGVGGRPVQRSGDGGGGRPRNGRARGHTHTHTAFFVCFAHLARAAPAGGAEVGGGVDGGGGNARDEGRRDGAVGGRHDARRGACEQGLSRVRRGSDR